MSYCDRLIYGFHIPCQYMFLKFYFEELIALSVFFLLLSFLQSIFLCFLSILIICRAVRFAYLSLGFFDQKSEWTLIMIVLQVTRK